MAGRCQFYSSEVGYLHDVYQTEVRPVRPCPGVRVLGHICPLGLVRLAQLALGPQPPWLCGRGHWDHSFGLAFDVQQPWDSHVELVRLFR